MLIVTFEYYFMEIYLCIDNNLFKNLKENTFFLLHYKI